MDDIFTRAENHREKKLGKVLVSYQEVHSLYQLAHVGSSKLPSWAKCFRWGQTVGERLLLGLLSGLQG